MEHAFNAWDGFQLREEDVLKLYSWAGGQHSMRGMEGEPDLISGYYHMKDALLEHCCMVHGARGMWLRKQLRLCTPLIGCVCDYLFLVTLVEGSCYQVACIVGCWLRFPCRAALSVPNSVQLTLIVSKMETLTLLYVWWVTSMVPPAASCLCNHFMKVTNWKHTKVATTIFSCWYRISDCTLKKNLYSHEPTLDI